MNRRMCMNIKGLYWNQVIERLCEKETAHGNNCLPPIVPLSLFLLLKIFQQKILLEL